LSDFLSRLAERALDPAGRVRPVIAPRFADVTPPAWGEQSQELEAASPPVDPPADSPGLPSAAHANQSMDAPRSAPATVIHEVRSVSEPATVAAATPRTDDASPNPAPRRTQAVEQTTATMPATRTVIAPVAEVRQTEVRTDRVIEHAPPPAPLTKVLTQTVQRVIERAQVSGAPLPRALPAAPAPGRRRAPAARRPPPETPFFGSPVADETVINVTIGRVEVRAAAAEPAVAPKAGGPASPRLSLDEYLVRRQQGGRG
jgi:hypothetical protein